MQPLAAVELTMDIDFEALKAPTMEQPPCGPDLEEAGDPEFWQFTSAIESDVPSNFAEFFEHRHANTDFSPQIKTCYELLERSRDLRLVIWLAKLLILNRDLQGFVKAIGYARWLIENHWEEVHPLPFEGDNEMRMINLERLDERPSVELPLQYAKLVEDQVGTIAFRDHMAALSEIEPREGERFRSADDMNKVLNRCDVDNLVSARDRIANARETLDAMRAIWLEKAGYDNAFQLERLPALLKRMHEYLNKALADRRPDLASEIPQTEETGSEAGKVSEPAADTSGVTTITLGPQPKIAKASHAIAALEAINAYFTAREPSSPARILVIQAEQLVGRSFIDVISTLLPGWYDYAKIKVDGSDFALTLNGLYERLTIPEFAPEHAAEGDDSESETPEFTLIHRNQTASLLSDVAAYFRHNEPSSPIPVLLDRAQALMQRDFAALVREITADEQQ